MACDENLTANLLALVSTRDDGACSVNSSDEGKSTQDLSDSGSRESILIIDTGILSLKNNFTVSEFVE